MAATNGQDIANLVKTGALNLDQLKAEFATAENGVVSIQDWGICYSSGTGQLSEFCTVVATNQNNPITGVGLIAYSGNGSQLYAVQYSNGFSSDMFNTSIGTTLYNPQDGNTALCVVYGWTEQSSFYFTQNMTIGSCD